jgi:spore coat protein A
VKLRRDGRPQASTEPGREGVEPDKDVAALPAWSVTHLHGAQTGGGNDGWADNAVASGDAQLSAGCCRARSRSASTRNCPH